MKSEHRDTPAEFAHLALEATADGSWTFFSEEFGEAFHSRYGARQEAIGKFVEPTLLAQKAQTGYLRLLDICYGLGYNSAAALETIWSVNPDCRVELVALELDRAVPQAAIKFQLHNLWSSSVQTALVALAHTGKLETSTLQATLLPGDARQQIQLLAETIQTQAESAFDGIFLDPFSPPHCPQLWTVEFLALVARCLKPAGRLATYSCAASVRTALLLAGLQIGSTAPVGRRSPGTIASFSNIDLPALSLQEQEHLETKAAIPYRDPDLQDDAETILKRRQQEQQVSTRGSTSHWKKRWSTLNFS